MEYGEILNIIGRDFVSFKEEEWRMRMPFEPFVLHLQHGIFCLWTSSLGYNNNFLFIPRGGSLSFLKTRQPKNKAASKRGLKLFHLCEYFRNDYVYFEIKLFSSKSYCCQVSAIKFPHFIFALPSFGLSHCDNLKRISVKLQRYDVKITHSD